jgi:hypothetical protein
VGLVYIVRVDIKGNILLRVAIEGVLDGLPMLKQPSTRSPKWVPLEQLFKGFSSEFQQNRSAQCVQPNIMFVVEF